MAIRSTTGCSWPIRAGALQGTEDTRSSGRNQRAVRALVRGLHGERRGVVPDVAVEHLERAGGGVPVLPHRPGGERLRSARYRRRLSGAAPPVLSATFFRQI